MMGRQPADPADQVADDELLRQRLAAVSHLSTERTTAAFRRRRSSGLLFQIRRKVQRAEMPAAFMRPGPPLV